MTKLTSLFSRIIDTVVASLLAIIFLTFLAQVISRYIFNSPLGWTLELISILWLWLIFIGAGFAVRERDHVRFDMIYLAAPQKLRILFGLISCASIIVAAIISFPATYEWVWQSLMSRRDSALLKIPMSIVMSAYLVFLIASIIRYSVQFYTTLRSKPFKTNGDAQ